MSIDIFVLLIMVVFFFKGFSKGLIMSLFSALALLLGIVVALTFAQRLSSFLLENDYVSGNWAPMISYLLLFLGVMWLVRLMGNALEGILKIVMMSWANKLAGALLYSFVGAVLASTVLWMATSMHLLSDEALSASVTYKKMAPLAPWFFDFIAVLLPFAKNVFAELQSFFSQLNREV